jgi:hypothetical protein
MSLHTAAKYLESRGRGNDKMLVHMTPSEVKGLQSLAMAAGGSLSINPETGLAEAGFLESILPMLAGAGLMMIPGVGPLAAAGMVGGATGIATGSLEKGLMAGLGAYGGAGMAGSLSSAGGSALAEAGGSAATNLGEQALTNTATQALPAGYDVAGSAFSPTEMLQGSVNPSQFAGAQASAAQSVLTPQNFPGLAPEQLSGIQSAVPNMANPMQGVRAAGMANATTGLTPTTAMGKGLGAVTSSPSAAGSFLGDNMLNIGAAAIPALAQDTQDYTPMTEEEESELQRISPNFRAMRPTRPNPYYQARYPTYGAQGGIMQAYQAGGPVERMSQMNTALNPQGGLYPQGMVDKTQYALPTQRPTSMEVLDAGAQRMFAEGGIARYAPGGVAHLPVKGTYRDSDSATANKDAYEAAMIRLNKIRKGANLSSVSMPKSGVKGLGDLPELAAGGSLGGYSDGGRMLKGPGDGMSDSIPGVIGNKQPARLADGEFVVPADVVSHLGNGSTDAGAKKLYSMMDKIRKARTGTKKQGKKINPNKFLPA